MKLMETWVEITAHDTALKSGMRNARGYVKGQISEMQGLLDKLSFKSFNLKSMFIGGAAATGVIYGLKSAYDSLIGSVIKSRAELDEMSIRTGIAVEDLSRLKYMASVTGTNLEGMEKSVRKLAINMLEISRGKGGTAGETFKQLGLSVTDASGNLKPLMGMLGDISDKLRGMKDETARAAMASQIFGARTGPQLLPMLMQGKAGIEAMSKRMEELGLLVSTKTAGQAHLAEVAMIDFTGSITGLKNSIATGLIPTFTLWFQGLTAIVVANREVIKTQITNWIGMVAGALKTLYGYKDVIKVVFEIILYKALFSYIMNIGRAVMFVTGTLKGLAAVQGVQGVLAMAGGAGSAIGAVNAARVGVTATGTGLAAAQAAQTGAIAFGATAVQLKNAQMVQMAAVRITETTVALTAATGAQTAATAGLATATTALNTAASRALLTFGAFSVIGGVLLVLNSMRGRLNEIKNMTFDNLTKLAEKYKDVSTKDYTKRMAVGPGGRIASGMDWVQQEKAAVLQRIDVEKNLNNEKMKGLDIDINLRSGIKAVIPVINDETDAMKKSAAARREALGFGVFGTGMGVITGHIATQHRDFQYQKPGIGQGVGKNYDAVSEEEKQYQLDTAQVLSEAKGEFAQQLFEKQMHIWDEEKNQIKSQQQAWMNFGDTISQTMIGAMETSGNVFQNIANGFKNMLESMVAQAIAKTVVFAVLNAVTGGTFSAGMSMLSFVSNGIFKASGGPVSSGRPYMVGERGPEMFVPKVAGTIIPNGAGTTIHDNSHWTININEADASRMAPMTPEQFARTFKECERDGRIKIRKSA